GINHFSFGITWMNNLAFYFYYSSSSIEVFIFQLTNLAAVHGVSPICTKFFHIEFMGTTTNFFVWSKTNTNRSMLYLRMIYQILHGRNNFCDSSFIVCS